MICEIDSGFVLISQLFDLRASEDEGDEPRWDLFRILFWVTDIDTPKKPLRGGPKKLVFGIHYSNYYKSVVGLRPLIIFPPNNVTRGFRENGHKDRRRSAKLKSIHSNSKLFTPSFRGGLVHRFYASSPGPRRARLIPFSMNS